MEQPQKQFRTWIELDMSALDHNYRQLRSVLGNDMMLMAIVKSNAYGHGLVDFSRELSNNKVNWFGVDSVVEATRLREENIETPILVLGYTLQSRIMDAVSKKISLTASSFEFLESCLEFGLSKQVTIHIKVDTGLHRQGFSESDIEKLIKFLLANKDKFDVEGLYTHFAKAKDPNDKTYTLGQIKSFSHWIDSFKKAGFYPIIHASATAGMFVYPETRYHLVRSGAGLYGIWPSDMVKKAFEKNIKLEPVLSWRTIISETKKLPGGSGISYDLTETLTRDSTVAVCPVGYWHGFPRSLSSSGEVLVNGVRAKVLGRVAMDMIIIDVTGIPDVKTGTVVTLIGTDGEEKISAEEVAERAGTTSYEILTRLNPLIQKIKI